MIPFISDTGTIQVLNDDWLTIHSGSPTGISSAKKVRTVTQANLTVANLLVWEHGLNEKIAGVELIDPNGEHVECPVKENSDNVLVIDFTLAVPIVGTWYLVII